MAAGMTAGLLGGIAFGVLSMVVSAALGQGFWFPMQLIGGLFYGVNVILGGNAPAITGIFTHLIWAVILGGIFASFVRPYTADSTAVIGGLVFGVAVWAVMTYAILPWANPTLSERVALMPNWWFAYHLVFGLVLGSTPALMRAYARSARDIELPETSRRAA